MTPKAVEILEKDDGTYLSIYGKRYSTLILLGYSEMAKNAILELSNTYEATVTQNEAYRQLVADLKDDISRLQRVARIAAQILFVVSHTQRPTAVCEHGNAACYPTPGWWCDDCFGELQESLDLANVEYIPKPEEAE